MTDYEWKNVNLTVKFSFFSSLIFSFFYFNQQQFQSLESYHLGKPWLINLVEHIVICKLFVV